MAGAALAVEGELHVLLVRHGESTNNPLMAEIFAPVAQEAVGSEARRRAEATWLARRSSDPELTAKGRREATAMAQALAVPRGARLWASPFRRTLDTAKALQQCTGCRVQVHPELYEVRKGD